jgi:hypothetical protein
MARVWLRRASVWAAGWLLSGALYLLLIDNPDLPELLVGAGAATLAALGFELAREQYIAAESVRLSWLVRVVRPLRRVPPDTVALCRVAIAQLRHPQPTRGVFRAVPFRSGDDEAREGGRRALAESFGSLAPNTIVIGVDPERELLLGHQLRPGGGAEAIDVLELG